MPLIIIINMFADNKENRLGFAGKCRLVMNSDELIILIGFVNTTLTSQAQTLMGNSVYVKES